MFMKNLHLYNLYKITKKNLRKRYEYKIMPKIS